MLVQITLMPFKQTLFECALVSLGKSLVELHEAKVDQLWMQLGYPDCIVTFVVLYFTNHSSSYRKHLLFL